MMVNFKQLVIKTCGWFNCCPCLYGKVFTEDCIRGSFVCENGAAAPP